MKRIIINQMKANKASDMIEIFAGSSFEAEIVRSLLKDSEIGVFLKDENMGNIAPWHVSGGGVDAVKVVISSKDYDKAKIIIEEFNKNQNPLS